MKNKIIAITLAAVIIMPTAAYAKPQKEAPKGKPEIHSSTVKAEDKSKEQENKKEQSDKANKAKNEENKVAIEQFKAQIKAKHEIMKANTKKIVELKKQINAKKQKLSSILEEIKAGNKTLSPEQLELLTTKTDVVKETANEVKTLPAVSSDVEATQENIKGKRFEAALSSLDKVIAKQEARYAKLVELNTKLDALLAIAEQAQTVVEDTTAPKDTTNTTDTNNTDTTNSADATNTTETTTPADTTTTNK